MGGGGGHSRGFIGVGVGQLSIAMIKLPEAINLQRRKAEHGSQIQRLQTSKQWALHVWASGEEENHTRMCDGASGSPQGRKGLRRGERRGQDLSGHTSDPRIPLTVSFFQIVLILKHLNLSILPKAKDHAFNFRRTLTMH